MKDLIIRVQEEKNELHGRILRLRQFIKSDKFQDVSDFQREKLKEQYEIMTRYYGVLNVRLRDLEMQQANSGGE